MIVRALLISLSLVSLSFGQQVVVVVLDDSGSMDQRMRSGPRRIDAAKSALITVLKQLPTDAEIGVVALNGPDGSGQWIKPLGPVDRSSLESTIRRITAGGSTPLGEFMKVGTDALLAHRAKAVYGDYRLLIVTDGEANDSELLDRYLPDILSRAITVDVIGVDMVQDHSLATRVDNYRRADDPQSLQRAIEESLAETQLDGNDLDETAGFELLQGLPDEIAVAAIGALCRNNNGPIGQPPPGDEDQVVYHTPQAPGQPPLAAPAKPPHKRGLPISTVLVGIALLLAILFGSAIKGMRRV